jgi:hypothetical protein
MKAIIKKVLDIIRKVEKDNKNMTPDFYFALDLVKTEVEKL